MNKIHDVNSLALNSRGGAANMRPYIGADGQFYVNVFKGGDKSKIQNYEKRLVANATLRYDEWKQLDEAVIRVAEQRLTGFEDLRRNRLVRPLGNAMGTTVLTWENMSDAMEAVVSMDPVKKGNNDRATFDLQSIPIPVVHADFVVSERALLASRNLGNGIDTMNVERATRKVNQALEDMLFGSTATLTYGGGTIHSYISHPDNNDVTLVTAWDASGATPAGILADVLAMKQASIDDLHYGPWMLYVPTSYETVLDQDYDSGAGNPKTIRQRIMDIDGIQGVKVVDRLAADKVLLVQMTSDVVDLIDGMPIQTVQWDSEGGFIHNFKVMTIQVPRIKSDDNNRSGIVVLA